MAFHKVDGGLYIALSTDAKATLGVLESARLVESDTGRRFIFSDGVWLELPSQEIDALGAARGQHAGVLTVNIYGRTDNADDGVLTDVWEIAAQPVWIAPTQARTHQIVSSDAGDDGDPVGVGARTIRVSGLTSWTTKEVTEDIVLNGVTNVPTVNAYVMINRLQVLTSGGTSINVGIIKATADTDGTITCQIAALRGESLTTVCGISSLQTMYVSRIYGNMLKSGGGPASCDINFCYNREPDVQGKNFVDKHTFGILSTGTSSLTINYGTHKKLVGPALVKMQALSSLNDLQVSAGYDHHLIDN